MNIQVLKKENQKLRKEIERLNKLVTIDFLTKLYNRRAFSKSFKIVYEELKWATKHKTRRSQRSQFSLIIIDIDDFKKFNDKFGHLYGDKILKKVAKFLKNSVRDFDVVARWGGEEFAIILKDVDLSQAKKRTKIILEGARDYLPVTFSIGITQCNQKYSLKQIFEKADEALMKAKKQGKNQIVVG